MALYNLSGMDCVTCSSSYGMPALGRTRAQRKEARKARKAKRRSGENCTGATAPKYMPILVAGRKAYLAMVRLNIFNLGKKLYIATKTESGKQKIYEKWCKVGGNAKVLRATIEKAAARLRRRKKISGDDKTAAAATAAAATAAAATNPTIAAIIAAATPIIVALAPLLKGMANEFPAGSEEAAILSSEGSATTDASSEEIKAEAKGAAQDEETEGKGIKPIYLIAGAGVLAAFFLFRKK